MSRRSDTIIHDQAVGPVPVSQAPEVPSPDPAPATADAPVGGEVAEALADPPVAPSAPEPIADAAPELEPTLSPLAELVTSTRRRRPKE